MPSCSLAVSREKRRSVLSTMRPATSSSGSTPTVIPPASHAPRAEAAREAYAKAAALGVADEGFEGGLTSDDSNENTASDASIRGSVRLHDEASKLVGTGETVYITAKSVNGSPMPLAVMRRSADDLPFDFTLDNSNSMVAGPALQIGQKVIVSAKISKTGDALLTAGELIAVTEPIDPADDVRVDLVIGAAAIPDR